MNSLTRLTNRKSERKAANAVDTGVSLVSNGAICLVLYTGELTYGPPMQCI